MSTNTVTIIKQSNYNKDRGFFDSKNYWSFKPGDRFNAMVLGYSHTYRVKKIFKATVNYCDKNVAKEFILETKGGLVFTTHICGELLNFNGNSYEPCEISKTWLSYKLNKGEQACDSYAPGEK